MNNRLPLLLCILFMFLLTTFVPIQTQNWEQDDSGSAGETVTIYGEQETPVINIPVGQKLDAVCIHEGVWMRNMPTNHYMSDFKWVEGLHLGDRVLYLGETSKLDGKADEEDMIKIMTLNGKVGWVPYMTVVINAVKGVVIRDTQRF